MVHSVADAAGEQALGCPHLADLTHLVILDLGRDGQMLSRALWAEGQRGWEDGNVWGWHKEEVVVRDMSGQVRGEWVCLWG